DVCFFFSSRRRHTRFKCDWSSDVCSSDLVGFETVHDERPIRTRGSLLIHAVVMDVADDADDFAPIIFCADANALAERLRGIAPRSEERRVGKKCSSRAVQLIVMRKRNVAD